MEQEIGTVAGKVWSYLDKNGETSVSQLRQRLKTPDRLIHMALGWLAREGKVAWSQQARALYVDIRREGS